MAKGIGMALAALLAAHVTGARAAEITVYSSVGVKGVLEELAPKFEQSSGHKLVVTWSTGALLQKRFEGGEMADVFLGAPSNVEALLKAGKLAPGTQAKLAKSIIAVAVKSGAPKPDISSPEALKNALLSAKAISYTNPAAGGASGVYFAKQLERLGIAAQMKDKTKYPPAGGFAGALLLSGEADIAIQTTPELAATKGVDIVGPLPGDMAFTAAFVAAVGAGAKEPAGGRAFIAFLTSPEAQAAFKAKGYDRY